MLSRPVDMRFARALGVHIQLDDMKEIQKDDHGNWESDEPQQYTTHVLLLMIRFACSLRNGVENVGRGLLVSRATTRPFAN
jgi:hypothetical protein